MKLHARDRTFTVHIFYDPPLEVLKRKYTLPKDAGRTTIVNIHEGECDRGLGKECLVPSTDGVAECSVTDVFVKRKGRKIALSRALLELLPGETFKKFRSELWEDFRRLTKEIV